MSVNILSEQFLVKSRDTGVSLMSMKKGCSL